jgi:outer membrane receptor protein involved in Fe transport
MRTGLAFEPRRLRALFSQSDPTGWTLLLAAVALLAFPTTGLAQQAASINGTITDPTGAVVPGATVVLRNVATGVERRTVSNDAGLYVFREVLPGRYSIEVRKEGFTTAQEIGVTLLVGQTTTYDFTLSVGSTLQTITVEAAVAPLQTSTAGLGTAVTTVEVNELPLNGRNFSQLLMLTPGVSPANVSQNVSGAWTTIPHGTFVVPSVNGQTNRSNMFLLDGVNDNEAFTSTFLITPILDDIQEFKVEAHNDQPQYGGGLGGVVNVVTKSGTNALRGAAWDFLRNEKLDARNPFFAKRNPLRMNQFGANAGGPVVLPGYNGRNKTFFFGSYEGIRRVEASRTLYKVPTDQELTGDLSGLGVPIYDPFSTREDPENPGQFLRDEFPGGIIPPERLDQNMVTYAKSVYPRPVDTGDPRYNGLDNRPRRLRNDQWNVRIDEQLNPSNALWGRLSKTQATRSQSGGMATMISETKFWAWQGVVGWQHTFGPTSILQLRFNRNVGTMAPSTSLATGNSEQIIEQVNFSRDFACNYLGPKSCLLPGMSITGYAGATESRSGYWPGTDIWQFKADYSKVFGRHTFNMGADVNTNNEGPELQSYGDASFTSFQTANLQRPAGTGSALASFLLGVPDSAGRRSLLIEVKGGWVNGFYFTDQWKVTNRLTLNLGVRYDYSIVPSYPSTRNQEMVGDYDFSNGTYILEALPPACDQAHGVVAPCIPGGVLPDHVVVAHGGRIYSNHMDNIQPRVGFAYRPGSKFILRGGYGRFFDNWASVIQTSRNYQGTWPTLGQTLAQNLNTSYVTQRAENPYEGVLGMIPGPTPFNQTAWFADPHIRNPYSDQWNFGIQYQLGSAETLTADYVGSRQRRLDVGAAYNVAVTPGPGDAETVASRRPYPYISPTFYDRSVGYGSYNAFQFSLRRSAAEGLAYLISYTWSKSIDVSCSGWYGVEGCSTLNPYHLEWDKSVSGFDLTHILSASWVYTLPFGRGKRFSTGSRAANYLVGNWKLNGILTYTSGLPYEVGVSGDIANTGMFGCCNGYYMRLNLVGDPKNFTLTPENGLNRAAFAVPARYTYGNLGRNALRADDFVNFDFSIIRDFPIAEEKRLEFRADFFNLTNHPTWGIPVRDYNDVNFGVIRSTRSTERQIQMALKLYF